MAQSHAEMDRTEEMDEPEPLGRGFMLWQITNGWQRAIRAALAPLHITYVQVILLAGLKERIEAGGPINQASLAQSLGADVMMTSQVLRSLEAVGLVQRDRNPVDTRARTLALTPAGAARLAEALPQLERVDAEFFDALGRREDRFAKSLRKLWRKRRHATPALDHPVVAVERARPIPVSPVPVSGAVLVNGNDVAATRQIRRRRPS
ncbi:MAG TPA: MarR family winged helix-turn-helix transcriptional regulator [Stellaceae bacterium]|nr:MarR family winged helix-turn-helix transcriptional regulator [Stellaceae bacterium]